MRVTYSCDLCVWALWKAQESAGFKCQRCGDKELNGVGDNGIPRSGTGLRVIEEINARLRDIRLRCVHGVSLDIRIEFVFMRVTTLSCPERCLCSRILGRIYAG
jgi:hypothetical protein